MKRFLRVSLTALALLAPVTASAAQDWTLVYRPELRGMVAMRVKPATPPSTAAAAKHACCAETGERCSHMQAKAGEVAGHHNR